MRARKLPNGSCCQFRKFFSGVTLISLGLVGDYISRIYDESKHRPLYVVDEVLNLEVAAGHSARGLFLERKASKAAAASSNPI